MASLAYGVLQAATAVLMFLLVVSVATGQTETRAELGAAIILLLM
jgi:hypothetical protein